MSRILVVNAGSSSLKYQVVDPADGEVWAKGLVERIGSDDASITHTDADGATSSRTAPAPDHTAALELMQEAVRESGHDFGEADLVGVGHRVVHGGRSLFEPAMIDERVESEIDRVSVLAPLHNPAALQGIRGAKAVFADLPQVAVFDTGFFHDLPEQARTYAIDHDLAVEHAIRRYGAHGTSHDFVSAGAADLLGRPREELRLIVAHLGNGASISAVDRGRAVDTSMGLTPLEGLVMGTRSGDLDPSILAHLNRVADWSIQDLDQMLNKQSGLLGLCGRQDFRDVVDAMDDGDELATVAYRVFLHRLQKYIGAYLAVLQGADALTFTAGIGEHSARLRADVVSALGWAGATLDVEANESGTGARRITTPDSSLAVLVVPTNEELAIARAVEALIDDRKE